MVGYGAARLTHPSQFTLAGTDVGNCHARLEQHDLPEPRHFGAVGAKAETGPVEQPAQ